MRAVFLVIFVTFTAVLVPALPDQHPDLIVSPDGKGNVTTIQQAIDKVPLNNKARFTILVKPGVYKEQVRIPANKPFVSLIGESADKTVLTFGLSNKEAGST